MSHYYIEKYISMAAPKLVLNIANSFTAWKLRLCVGNSSVDKIYIIRPKPGPVAKNATPRPSGWELNPRPVDY